MQKLLEDLLSKCDKLTEDNEKKDEKMKELQFLSFQLRSELERCKQDSAEKILNLERIVEAKNKEIEVLQRLAQDDSGALKNL